MKLFLRTHAASLCGHLLATQSKLIFACAVAICLAVAPTLSLAEDQLIENFLHSVSGKDINKLFPIFVDGKEIKRPPGKITPQQLVPLSRQILTALEKCKKSCDLTLGKKTFPLKIPPLGQGERGVVFRVKGTGQVIKLSKPELKSLAILQAEGNSQEKWASTQTRNFHVKERAFTDASGLFSVMEEVKGEPLTSAMFRMGILQMNPLSNNVTVLPDTSHVSKQNQEKIWAAIQDMQQVVDENPTMRTSLSPNNIFVTWTDDGKKIKSIHLIDFGIDGTGDPRYQMVKSANEYYQLSAEKIKGYLAKYKYVDDDLFQLQEEARKTYNLPRTFDPKQEQEQILKFARRALPETLENKVKLKALLQTKLPKDKIPSITIDGVKAAKPKTLGELQQLSALVYQTLINRKNGIVELKLDNETLKVRTPALGQGDRGVVFAIEGSDEVIKVPKPDLASILTLEDESVGYKFWHDKSLARNSSFTVPERKNIHPLGLYSVMSRDHGEPLTKAMLRLGLLSFDPETQKATAHVDQIAAIGENNAKKIEQALLDIKKIMQSNPEMSLSISPNNLHVSYADAEKTIISKIALIDVGFLGPKSYTKFDGIQSLEDYITFSEDRLEKYLRLGYADDEMLALNRAQMNLNMNLTNCSDHFKQLMPGILQ